jgi:hypothetical protein
MIGGKESTVRQYGVATGPAPTWDALEELKAYNLATAFKVIRDRYGDRSLQHFEEMS